MIPLQKRHLVLDLIEEAVTAGARQYKACELIGISSRTPQDAGENI
jgi:hypothetical protein